MTSIIVFIAVTIMAIFTAISIYKIIKARVTYKKYYPYRKLVTVTLIGLPWIFLVFPFTLDWSTYITLVIVRIPYTIIWSRKHSNESKKSLYNFSFFHKLAQFF